MEKLPQWSFSEGFYIWFNPEAKEEYYSTPMYMYKTRHSDDIDNHKRRIVQEKDFYKKKPSKKERYCIQHQYIFHIVSSLVYS